MKRFPWDTVGMILSCAGNVFIVFKSPLGFVVWTAGNIAWITHGVKVRIDGKPQRPLIVMMLVELSLVPMAGWKPGCGASGGFAPTREEAAKKWNRRVDTDGK